MARRASSAGQGTAVTKYVESPFGFQFGPARVEKRSTDDDGSVVVVVSSRKQLLDIKVTKSGLIKVGKVREVKA